MRQRNRTYLYPHEVFDKLNKIESFHERVDFLRQNSTYAIKTILQCNFSPNIILDLPDGTPPFKPDEMPAGYSLGRIDKSIKVLGRLVKGNSPSVGLSKIKKETLFIQLLEGIHVKDAQIIVYMKDKIINNHYTNVDYTLVKTAFPALLE